jgi:hypothetical protein
MIREIFGARETEAVIEIVGEEIVESAINLGGSVTIMLEFAKATFDRKLIFTREIGGEIEGFLGFRLGVEIVAEMGPCVGKLRVRKCVIGIYRDGLFKESAGRERVECLKFD